MLERVEHTRGLESRMEHASGAASVIAGTEPFPQLRLEQLLERLRVTVRQEVARFPPTPHRVGGDGPRSARVRATAPQKVKKERVVVERQPLAPLKQVLKEPNRLLPLEEELSFLDVLIRVPGRSHDPLDSERREFAKQRIDI